MKTFWLSFVGDSGNLGCTIVDVTEIEALVAKIDLDIRFPQHMDGAEWVAAALTKAHQLGVNPGGQVASWEITNATGANCPFDKGRLYSRAEVEVLDKRGES